MYHLELSVVAVALKVSIINYFLMNYIRSGIAYLIPENTKIDRVQNDGNAILPENAI